MTTENQSNTISSIATTYVDRPELEILQIYDRRNPEQIWGTGIVETIYNDPNTDSIQDYYNEDRITIYFERITGKENSKFYFTASHTYRDFPDSKKEIISLTGGSVSIHNSLYRGQRIGTWMMNEIVKWAKQWPDANILKITLGEGDAYDENMERRNRFYEQFGIEFNYHDESRKTGASRSMKAHKLNTVDFWDKNKNGNIIVQNCRDFMISVITKNDKLLKENNEITIKNEKLKKKISFFESNPIKTGIKQILGLNKYR